MRAAPEIRRMATDDIAPVSAALARAFFDDPLQVWALPDESTRASILERMFSLQTEHVAMPFGECWTDASCASAALWLPPPGTQPLPPDTAAALAPLAELLGDAEPRLMAAMRAMREAHPDGEPHWYLQGLGTDPPLQGRGLGRSVVAPVLRRCDTERMPAYLESTKERNIAFYERLGFRLTGVIDVPPDGPSLYKMWRDPQPGA